MKLIDTISETRSNLHSARLEVSRLEIELRNLDKIRANTCAHVWKQAVPGYEHEGRECVHCGINELYYLNLKL